MATLRVTSGPATGRTLTFDRRTVIGRSDADLEIDDDQLSRNHVAVEPIEDGVVVEDLQSTNGTFVNGERVAGRVTVREDATLRAGTSEIAIEVPVSEKTRVRAPREPRAEPTLIVSPPGATAAPTLTVRSGPLAGEKLAIDRPILIGRGSGDLTLADAAVSDRHAELRPGEPGVVVQDLGSTNGTFVDGERVTGAVTLTRDATVRIGSSEIALEIPAATAGGTEVRDHVVAGPADVTQAHAAPPATSPPPVAAPAPVAAPPPPAAAPAGAAPSPTAGHRRGGRTRPELLIRGAMLLGALSIVVVLVAAQTGKTRHTFALRNTLRTAVLTQTGLSITFLGLQTGPPTGTGAATIDQTFVPPPGKPPLGVGVPTKFTAKVTSHFDDGSITSIITGTATRQRDTSVKVVGQGTIVGGTGKYKGAKGSYTQTGGRPPRSDRAVFELTGSVRY
jgi:pSer/pThr/pTyr-binding forkhead associated (FHA) protein